MLRKLSFTNKNRISSKSHRTISVLFAFMTLFLCIFHARFSHKPLYPYFRESMVKAETVICSPNDISDKIQLSIEQMLGGGQEVTQESIDQGSGQDSDGDWSVHVLYKNPFFLAERQYVTSLVLTRGENHCQEQWVVHYIEKSDGKKRSCISL